jgi:hypothetical protein
MQILDSSVRTVSINIDVKEEIRKKPAQHSYSEPHLTEDMDNTTPLCLPKPQQNSHAAQILSSEESFSDKVSKI